LVSNSQFPVKPLDVIVGKAWSMFASKWVKSSLQSSLASADDTAAEQEVGGVTVTTICECEAWSFGPVTSGFIFLSVQCPLKEKLCGKD
jgi:hypothetical protein